jgi:putative redox protein
MTTHSVKTVHTKNMTFIADIQGHEIIMDTTTDDGGDAGGASPKRLMLASLAGCTGMDVVSILKKMKVHFTDFSIEIEASLTEDHPKIYNRVNLVYKINVAGADKEKVEKAVSLSQDKYCGVSAMFRAFAELETRIDFFT